MVRGRQQYISHVAEDENLPQEVGDFKELQIIRRDEEDQEGEGHRRREGDSGWMMCDGVCVICLREGRGGVKDSDHIRNE